MPDPIIIDPHAIANLRELSGGDDAFLREILGIYLQDTPERLAELRTHLASGEKDAFIRAAHTIKGSSSNIGAEEVRVLAGELEHRAKNTPITDLAAEVTALEAAYGRARDALQTHLG